MAQGLVCIAAAGLVAATLGLAGAQSARLVQPQGRLIDCASACARQDAVSTPADAPSLSTILLVLNAERPQSPTNEEALPISSSPDIPSPRFRAADMAALALRCAPTTPESVVVSLVTMESGGRPWLVARNGARRAVFAAANRQAAEETVNRLTAAGDNIDVGLMQLNSSTLRRLGVDVHEALDPCRSIALGARLFDGSYARSASVGGPAMPLMAAYSIYNTGTRTGGFVNGYVERASRTLQGLARGG